MKSGFDETLLAVLSFLNIYICLYIIYCMLVTSIHRVTNVHSPT